MEFEFGHAVFEHHCCSCTSNRAKSTIMCVRQVAFPPACFRIFKPRKVCFQSPDGGSKLASNPWRKASKSMIHHADRPLTACIWLFGTVLRSTSSTVVREETERWCCAPCGRRGRTGEVRLQSVEKNTMDLKNIKIYTSHAGRTLPMHGSTIFGIQHM